MEVGGAAGEVGGHPLGARHAPPEMRAQHGGAVHALEGGAAGKEVQQGDGVAAAGEPNTQPGMGRQAGSEKGADPRRQIRKRLVP